MTGDELGVAAQRVRDGQVAAAVARAVEDIASRLESGEGSWTQAGSAARAEVARWIRARFVPAGSGGEITSQGPFASRTTPDAPLGAPS